MAITVTNATFEPRSVSKGPIKYQIVEIVAASGATSGTLTASNLKQLFHVIIPGIKSHTAAPTFSSNVAALAFTVPAEVQATKTYQSALTLTAVAGLGSSGNNITLAFTGGGTNGSEVVTVIGNAISIQIQSGVSSANQVKTAYDLVAAATALAAMTIVGGHSADPISTAGASALTGGINGGYLGSAICIGR